MAKKSPFSKEFLDKVETILENEKLRLESELVKFAKKNPNVENDFDAGFPEYGDKPDENAQEIAEYEANLAEEDLMEHNLRDIEKALDRLEKGTYGICKYCGQPIDPRRLQARPTASSCIDCKTKLQNS